MPDVGRASGGWRRGGHSPSQRATRCDAARLDWWGEGEGKQAGRVALTRLLARMPCLPHTPHPSTRRSLRIRSTGAVWAARRVRFLARRRRDGLAVSAGAVRCQPRLLCHHLLPSVVLPPAPQPAYMPVAHDANHQAKDAVRPRGIPLAYQLDHEASFVSPQPDIPHAAASSYIIDPSLNPRLLREAEKALGAAAKRQQSSASRTSSRTTRLTPRSVLPSAVSTSQP